jgi:hypothetical protein
MIATVPVYQGDSCSLMSMPPAPSTDRVDAMLGQSLAQLCRDPRFAARGTRDGDPAVRRGRRLGRTRRRGVPSDEDHRHALMTKATILSVAAWLCQADRLALRAVSRKARELLDEAYPLQAHITSAALVPWSDPLSGRSVWQRSVCPTFCITIDGGGQCTKDAPYTQHLERFMRVVFRSDRRAVECLEFRHVNFHFVREVTVDAARLRMSVASSGTPVGGECVDEGVRRSTERHPEVVDVCEPPVTRRRLSVSRATASVGILRFVGCIGPERALKYLAACSGVYVGRCSPVTIELVREIARTRPTHVEIRGDVRFTALQELKRLGATGAAHVKLAVRRVLSCAADDKDTRCRSGGSDDNNGDASGDEDRAAGRGGSDGDSAGTGDDDA